MEALTNSPLRILAKKCNNKTLSAKTLLGRSDVQFLRPSKYNLHFNHSFSLRQKAIQEVASSHLSSDTEVLTDLETAHTAVQTIEPTEIVHVKFQLQKECKFGEQFLLVGDDPVIGSWNPNNALPLNWSDGHIWTVELDIPIELSIQFKFIFIESTGDVLWQPGPDRIFRAWETKNTIVIAEDWENAEVQKISEMQMINQNEGLVISQDLEPIVAENVTHPSEELIPILNEDIIHSDSIISGKRIIYSEDPLISDKELYIVEGGGHKKEEAISKNDMRTLTDKNPGSLEDKDYLVANEEGPVLVTGFTPLQVMSSDEVLFQECGKPIIPDASIGDHNMPEATC